ncbi:MAG: hypothetical protein AAGA65_01070 [Actinomycetota bacterium]
MTGRGAVLLAAICGLLVGACRAAPPDGAEEDAAVLAGATASSTAPSSAARSSTTASSAISNSRTDGSRSVLQVPSEQASETTGTATDTAAAADNASSPSTATSTSSSTSALSPTPTTSPTPTLSPTPTTSPTSRLPTTSPTSTAATTTAAPTTITTTTTGPPRTTAGPPADGDYFATMPVGSALPSDSACAARVNARSSGREVRAENGEANQRVEDPSVDIDGADGSWNSANASRVTGNFTGTTEDILRWGACKWGFDEDITRARAVAESSWSINTEGDRTDRTDACATMGLSAPCNQSYGLLQVKGSVHEGTYPASKRATAFGVDYAMAWLRACYDGAMGWLGSAYGAGDEWGCIGAWFSGLWYDGGANNYVGEVRSILNARTWERY